METDAHTLLSVEKTFDGPSGRSLPSTYFSCTVKFANVFWTPTAQSKYPSP